MPAAPSNTRRRSSVTAKGGAVLTVAAVHTGVWLSAPTLAVVLTLLEASLTVMIIVTALYAPDSISDRAFRMLPWTTSKTEK